MLTAREVVRLPPSAVHAGAGKVIPAKVVVLVSGTGTLLRALLAAAAEPGYPVQICAVGVDRDCPATAHADAAGVPHFRVALRAYPDRAAWDAALTAGVARYEPDLVVTAGFMKILGPRFLERFGGRVINTHPALLPSFPGAHGVRDALAYGVRVTGATVHLADAGVDAGPILAQEAVSVLPADTDATLHERIKVVERRLLVEVVAAVALHGVVSDGRRAEIPSESPSLADSASGTVADGTVSAPVRGADDAAQGGNIPGHDIAANGS